ncbi:MAG TPA: ArsR family transcriptional regulator [Euryarchaeota archaeon]|nr:ArsR family transcriptional regulator [Thermoplasmatales archaeon]HEC95917.1 ArsR family transcriptional regulator [Euryarchaeota archaeon]
MSIVSSAKLKILKGLDNHPMHGYEISKKLNMPISSVYEHLKELREGGLISYEESDRKKVYHLTEKGKMLLEALK